MTYVQTFQRMADVSLTRLAARRDGGRMTTRMRARATLAVLSLAFLCSCADAGVGVVVDAGNDAGFDAGLACAPDEEASIVFAGRDDAGLPTDPVRLCAPRGSMAVCVRCDDGRTECCVGRGVCPTFCDDEDGGARSPVAACLDVM